MSTASNILTAGTKHHVVAIWSGGTVNLYVDNNLVINSQSQTLPSYISRDTQRLGDYSSATPPNQPLNGTIHSLRIWNDPSSFDATDVATLYADRDVLTSVF